MVDIFIKIDQKIRLFLRKYLLLIFFLAITIIAIYVRWICIEYESGDLQYYLDWYKQIKGNGGFQALKGQVGNYGEGYTLFLAVLTYLPVSPIYGIKLFSIVFDFPRTCKLVTSDECSSRKLLLMNICVDILCYDLLFNL